MYLKSSEWPAGTKLPEVLYIIATLGELFAGAVVVPCAILEEVAVVLPETVFEM